jgi:hypothetical protein
MKSHFVVASALTFSGLVFACFCTDSVAEEETGVQCLFDGKSLDGWEGKSQFWSVRDGVITGQTTADNPTKGNTFLIWRGGELGDFELSLQFRMVGGNSGIQYRSVELPDFVVSGYQADFEAGDRFIGILYEEKGRGILALRGQKVVIGEDGKKETVGTTCDEEKFLASIKKEDWNEYSITAKGNHLVQKINGFTTVDVTDNQASKARQKGILALQLHQGPPMLVQFKDIKLKVLK